MIKFSTLFFLLALRLFSQNVDSISIHSSNNIIKFANHLFCDQDYLRAAIEYLRIDELQRTDILNLNLGISLLAIGENSLATNVINKIDTGSFYFEYSRLELLKNLFMQKDFANIKSIVRTLDKKKSLLYSSGQKILAITSLKEEMEPISFEIFSAHFNDLEKTELKLYYEMKTKPDYKSPITAAILSALIPGAGKIYTNDVSNGIYAFLITGLFTFLTYDNFKAEHNFRAWIFTGLAAGFYTGNVYGSYTSAQIYNAKVKYEFNLSLDSFLKTKNYFVPLINLCD